MKKILNIPHRKQKSTCYINGLYDILLGKNVIYDYFLLPAIGGMAGFAYVKFKKANPDHMVFWGNRPKNLFRELEPNLKYGQEIIEGKSWKTTLIKIKESLNHNTPVVAGALGIYYLPYNKKLYKLAHIPIHYILIVGYDKEKEKFFVHDCNYNEIKTISYTDFKFSMDIKVPGMSVKNTIRMFKFAGQLPDELELAERGFKHKAEQMLSLPVSISGISAMHKLSKEIFRWNNKECFNHLIAYAGMTPLLIPGDLKGCNGLRFEQAKVLDKLGKKYNKKKWVKAADIFNLSGEAIIKLCNYALKEEKGKCSETIKEIANLEEKTYKILLDEDDLLA